MQKPTNFLMCPRNWAIFNILDFFGRHGNLACRHIVAKALNLVKTEYAFLTTLFQALPGTQTFEHKTHVLKVIIKSVSVYANSIEVDCSELV
jgi:hypothetical protein